MQRNKVSERAKTILQQKIKLGVLISASFKSDYKATVIDAVVTGIRKEKTIGWKEYNGEARNRSMPTSIFDRGAKKIQ